MRRPAAILALSCFTAAAVLAAPTAPVDTRITVDQFGYRPADQKIAVIIEPGTGFNAPNPITPAPVYEVRRWHDNTTVFTAPIEVWNSGQTHDQSGDSAWWFDFSSLQEIGTCYIYDPTNNIRSYGFEIRDDIYLETLKHALRTFYYQRCGIDKTAPYAKDGWVDTACHLHAEQDLDCHSVLDPVPATTRDLSGGWHDAGDYNKYVNFADECLHWLLAAYEENPRAWDDDCDIPGSGNGVPDILDEIKWEVDWLMRMQNPDGSVLHKVSVSDWGAGCPPSSDTNHRYYAQATASATISACGVFAHAGIVFKSQPDTAMQTYASNLQASAEHAWTWLEQNPGSIPSAYDNQGFASASAEDSAERQFANRVAASAYLLVLTGDTKYRTHFDNNYTNINIIRSGYINVWESESQDSLLYYTRSPLATPSITNHVITWYANTLSGHFNNYTGKTDPYCAHLDDHVWGSNRDKSRKGTMFMNMPVYNINAANHDNFRNAAQGYIHYIHGVNPLAFVYLTNMDDSGAENSITEIYHSWFSHGSDWDSSVLSLYGPPPGFLAGGPNPSYAPDPSYGGTIEPPQNQPTLKSYKDWNTSWPEDSWEITENHIPYQAAYIKLLSKFTDAYDADSDGLNDAWERSFFNSITNADQSTNHDSDRHLDSEEYQAGTDPTNSNSFFAISNLWQESSNVVIRWTSVSNRVYGLQYTSNLLNGSWTNVPSATNIPGTGTTNTRTNSSAGTTVGFYRLNVQKD
jgi:endoglucanase